MSNLLSQASLVMIPSGYKEDVVYSPIPTTGAGDLSFTRASNGTRVNSAGLVEVVAWNLVQNSENFSIDFIPINASISNNTTTAPNGTTTADSLIENTATDNHFAFGDSTQQSGVEYTYSVYAKSIGGRNIRVLGSSGFGGDVIVDLANGSVLSGSGVVQSVGNGWYRISITATTTTATVRTILYTVNGTSISYTGNGTSGVFLWGAQLNIGSTAKPYFPTTDRLNVPRLTYQNGGGGCPSLLLEKQSTNKIFPSEDFSTVWNLYLSATVTANTTISPDGTQNADTLNFGSNSDSQIYSNQGASPSASYTATIYAKSSTGKKMRFKLATVGGDFYSSDLTTTSNWQRFDFTYTQEIYHMSIVNESAGGSGTIQIWGAQMEASSYPTSYIPTTSASATRVADESSKTGISSLIGQTEGVLFVDFDFTAYDNDTKWIAFLGGGNNYMGFYTDGNSHFTVEVYDNAVSFLNGTFTFSIGQRYKLALAYKANDFAFYVNGTQVATDNSGSVPTVSSFNFNYNSSNTRLGGKNYHQVILFTTRLTNAELASLTTL